MVLKTTSRPRSRVLAALDLGSSKVCCFIARVDREPGGRALRPRVIGIGHQASAGMRAGTVIDMDAAEQCVRAAVHTAEKMAGVTIQKVVVNLSGGHPRSHTVDHKVPLVGTAGGREIADADLRRLLGKLDSVPKSAERALIHANPTGFSIDGSRGIRDPRGMHGETLGVQVHQVTAAHGPMRNLATVIARCHLEIHSIVVSSHAAGLASLVDDEMELGVTLIDMGAGTTSLAVFSDGQPVMTDQVPIGGHHVTQDIARGLSTSQAHAERMKTLYGHAVTQPGDERDMIEAPLLGEDDPNQAVRVPRAILVEIIQPRMEETFELVREKLSAAGLDRAAGRRAVLTGGASLLPGARDLAGQILDKRVRIGRPIHVGGLAESTGGPAFATCGGLLASCLQDPVALPAPAPKRAVSANGRLQRLGLWLREAF